MHTHTERNTNGTLLIGVSPTIPLIKGSFPVVSATRGQQASPGQDKVKSGVRVCYNTRVTHRHLSPSQEGRAQASKMFQERKDAEAMVSVSSRFFIVYLLLCLINKLNSVIGMSEYEIE